MSETGNDILKELAAYAPDDEFIPTDAFATEPPLWSHWDEMNMAPQSCGMCGAWCKIVRPGKMQCSACGDDSLTALALRAKKVLGLGP